MTSDILQALLRVNLVGAAAVLAVLALRLPVRRLFGPQVTYRLWAIPALACFATLLPARVASDGRGFLDLAPAVRADAPLTLALWAAGAVICAVMLWRAQARFLAAARAGVAGPAVVGVLAPRIVMPRDDGRYTAEERALIRAHEREHVLRQDPRAGALAAALQVLGWFNPLAHLAAYFVRLDQELACDAAVIRRHPRQRALYARTLLKTQLAAQPLPFGCHWPAHGRHPLELRVELLARPRRDRSLAGGALVAAAAIAASAVAWTSQPPIPPHPPFRSEVPEVENAHMSVVLITAPRAPRTP